MSRQNEGIQCEILDQMEVVWEQPSALLDVKMHYCPGCGHPVVHKVLMEVIDELNIQEKTVGIAPVGCAVLAYDYMDIDMQEAAHGRATAVATGIKRVRPDLIVFTYQGDGDLAAIGTSETIHTVNRGERIVIVFINNGIYGMTGGQMAPTTLPGVKTKTSPDGRDVESQGHPIKIAEMIALLPGAYYVTRQSVTSASGVRKLKKALLKAFQYQIEDKPGTSFIEVVTNCPAGWKMTPIEANRWLEKEVLQVYPLGDLKTPTKD